MSLAAVGEHGEARSDSVRALILDDDEGVLRAHARSLVSGGFLVETARDAATALAALRSRPFDVFVSDIRLPGTSGIELLSQMRQAQIDLPVVLITGHAEVSTAIKALEYGVLRYLEKPVAPRALVAAVGQVVQLHGIARMKRLALDNEGLQKLVEELDRARAAAERSSRVKSEFLAKMSHELRTPMTAVLGFTELVLDGEIGVEERGYLNRVQRAAKTLLGIIDDVLDVAELERGRVDLVAEPFDPRAVVEGAVERGAAAAREKGLALSSEVDADVPTVLLGDAGRLRRVLENLVGNAIRFTDEGSVRVHAELESEEGSGVGVRVTVADTGSGIAEDKLASIFEPFSQADNSSSRRHGGVGLGLTIAAQLAALLGGKLDVTSVLGVGTTFRFTAKLGRLRGGSA